MLKRKKMRRQKPTFMCRCTPLTGITALAPTLLKQARATAMRTIFTTRSTGVIAAAAVSTGMLLEQTGNPSQAIMVYRTAIRRIRCIDAYRAEDYYNFGPLPPNPHFRPWSARINDADALEVASCLDLLYKRLGMNAEAHQRQRIYRYYDDLFCSVYSACL